MGTGDGRSSTMGAEPSIWPILQGGVEADLCNWPRWRGVGS
jgi:hypothetical protein